MSKLSSSLLRTSLIMPLSNRSFSRPRLLSRSAGRRGAALVEMGMLVGLISVLVIGAVLATGAIVQRTFCVSGEALASAQGRSYPMICGDFAAGAGDGSGKDGHTEGETEDSAEGFTETEDAVSVSMSFSDQMFTSGDTGSKVILAQVSPSAPFQISLAITPQEANDPDREISACYQPAGSLKSYCSAPATSLTQDIPADAIAVGYRVTLPNDVRLWTNEVDIAINGITGLSPSSWEIDVSRETPPATLEPEFAFQSVSYPVGTTGTIEDFVSVGGLRNVSGAFSLKGLQGDYLNFYACYRMTAADAPVCGPLSNSYTDVSSVDVPADASEIGYRLQLPAAGVGDDWVALLQPSFGGLGESFTVTRENEDPVFTLDPNLPGDTFPSGTTSAQYRFFNVADLGETNMSFVFTSSQISGNRTVSHGPCYKMTAASSPVCDTDIGTGSALVTVPEGAEQIGYLFGAPDSPGPDTVATLQFRFTATSYALVGTTDIIRLQPDAVVDIMEPIPDVHLAYDKTGGQVTYLDPGAWNVTMTFTAMPSAGQSFGHYACKRRTSPFHSVCTTKSAGSTDPATQSVDASYDMIGYGVSLPSTPATEEETYVLDLNFRNTVTGDEVTRTARIIRDAPPAEE